MSLIPQFAEIILPLPMRQSYTYSIPENLRNEASVGKRVVVQFGQRKMYTGLIRSIHNDNPDADNIKEILTILDEEELINPIQIRFWDWMSDYYMCTTGEIFKASLPSGLKLESESRLLINEFFEPTSLKSSDQELIYRVISENNSLSIDDLVRLTGKKDVHRDLKKMIDSGAVIPEEKVYEKYKKHKETFVSLNPSHLDEDKMNAVLDGLTRAHKQKEALEEILRLSLKTENSLLNTVELPFTKLAASFGSATINSLVKREVLLKFEKVTGRFGIYSGHRRDVFPLDENQAVALDSINENFKEKSVVLLHGVTSSGKTEIYIHLIKKALEEGKQVLYLLPEIALTTQIVTRLKEVFGDEAGVYHSRFSDSERVEVFMMLKQKGEDRFNLILGVRSAIFLPFEDLGLIIVDEEHENTFKQYDPAPRYHARDAAIMLASMHGAKVLLGTATPSVESYTNAIDGKYGLVKLHSRFGNVLMPEIVVADTRRARLKKQMRSVFTPLLLKEIEIAVSAGKQVILFQNRRGYSSFLECEECGWIPRCNKCDVSLTYHKFENRLNCHYCGYSVKMPSRCDNCASTRLVTRGFGTELVEDEIETMLPGVRVGRLDLDTSRSGNGYERILEDFGSGKLDILVGTQMLSKGLDFERVSLVGILNADQMLNFPDFRAFERSYQLMAQVSGRAGRKDDQGKVIIQCSDPSHPIIQYVIRNDFAGMYKDQVYERQTFSYPPFVKLIKFILRGKDPQELAKAAAVMGEKMQAVFGRRVLGPQVPLVGRVKGWYLQQIMLKIEKKASFSRARALITEVIRELENDESFKKVRLNIDVDPA